MKPFLLISLSILTSAIGFSQSFKSEGLDSLFQLLDKKNKFMGSIAVSKNGKLLYSNTIGYADIEHLLKADYNTKYRIGSISKMFTASLILKAIEENKLSINQPLNRYFPEIKNSAKITIEHLLNHKSGIYDFTNDKNYLSYNTEFKSEKQVIAIIADGKSNFEPNSKVLYSNANFIILSYILEKIYKTGYEEILRTKIIKPLRLKNTYYGNKIQIQNKESYSYHYGNNWNKSPETDLSIPMGAGGIVSTTHDLTAFIEQLFKGKIISHKSLSLMKAGTDFHGIGIGMGMLAYTTYEKKNYGHNGAIDDFKSVLHYFPGEKLSIAITSNGSVYPIDSVLSCAFSSYFNKAFTMPTFTYLEVKPEVLELYTGQYASLQIPIKITISKNEKKLWAQVKGQPAFPLEATAENSFKFEQAGLVLEFNSGKNQMILKQGGQEFLFTKE